MTPGPALDALVARRLWRAIIFVEAGKHWLVEHGTHKRVPLTPYSTDIDEAQRVVRLMQSRGFTGRIGHDPEFNRYRAVFTLDDGRHYRWTMCETMPHALCVAALAALDGTNVEKA